MALRLAILTISDACSRGERADSSGDLIASWARERQYAVAERGLIPDDTVRISAALAEWADTDRVGFENKANNFYLLVEKDFKCLDNVEEDQSDNYPNPLAKK